MLLMKTTGGRGQHRGMGCLALQQIKGVFQGADTQIRQNMQRRTQRPEQVIICFTSIPPCNNAAPAVTATAPTAAPFRTFSNLTGAMKGWWHPDAGEQSNRVERPIP